MSAEATRKSVAFTEEKTIIEADGTVTMADSPQETEQPVAAVAAAEPVDAPAENEDLELSLMKKKKKKVKKAEDAEDEDEAPEGKEDGIDLSMMKKKKKKKVVAEATGEDDFAKKLKALKIDGGEDGEATEEAQAPAEEQDGDMVAGTGIWAHDESKPIKYDPMLERFFSLLAERNPEFAQGTAKSMKIPPPQCVREGPKKTIFANIAEICKRLKRTEEHVSSYLFAELGTSGSVDGSRRLVIKGRFQPKQMETVLRSYIIEYVTCRTCRSPDTTLERGENRLYFVTCNACGSRRSVQAIKTGFSAQIGKRKKMNG